MPMDELLKSPYLRAATLSDPFKIVQRLRDEDIRELETASGRDALHCLIAGVAFSEASYVAIAPDGTPVGIFGLSKSSENTATIWAVFTDDILRWGKLCFKVSREVLNAFNAAYPILHNRVDSRNTLHVEWLKSMGCLIVKEPVKVRGVPFLEFMRLKNV